MSQFNPITEAALRRAGWYPGRVVETWRYEADYEQAHLILPDFARQFLSEFGHLIIQPDPKPPADSPIYGACDVWFNTIYAGGSLGDEFLNQFAQVAEQEVAVVGEFNRYDENWYNFSYCVILLGSNGHFFYSLIDLDNLIFIGKDMNELYEHQLGIRPSVVLIETPS